MENWFLDKYIIEIKEVMRSSPYSYTGKMRNIHKIISRCIKVLGDDVGIDEKLFSWEERNAVEDAQILIDILEYYKAKNQNAKESTRMEFQDKAAEPMIFISHKSDDKKYGDALRNFIINLGVKNEQLIYTSHPLHKIPVGVNIYDYLRKNIHANVFMIILWSDEYLESPACLNEMGAAWVVQSDYINIYTPDFSFGNPKYRQCAVDTDKMGAVLKNDEHCKTSMLELKEKVEKLFNLKNDEKKVIYLLDQFMKEIAEDK